MAEAIVTEVAKDFITDSLKSVLGATINGIREEIALAWGFKAELRSLQHELKRVNYLVYGADNFEPSGNIFFDDWLKMVKAVAYEAEDVLDACHYQVLKRQIAFKIQQRPIMRPPGFKTKLRLFFSRSSNPVVFRIRMAHRVKSLKEDIAGVYAEANKLGIRPVEVVPGSSTPFHAQINATAVEDPLQARRERPDYKELSGRDQDREKIINHLRIASDSDRLLSVVGVYGMAGIGKTSLCRSITEGKEVTECFERRIWICVSHDFTFKRLLSDIVEQIDEKVDAISTNEAIVGRLQKVLGGRKYLLVLDDIWDTFKEYLEPFQSSLQQIGGEMGTTILVTSRSKGVIAELQTKISGPNGGMNEPCLYELGRLTGKDSRSLFEHRFGHDLSDPSMVAIGERLLKKCGGVPLAIKTLAGLLRSRRNMQEWREIEESGIWNEKDDILPSVKLSFKYLPYAELKKCFAYCAIFQEDERIDGDRLVQLWMAQGFLQPRDKMEEIGEKYLNILLDNSLLEEVPSIKVVGRQFISSFKMHDVVHTLTKIVSRGDICSSLTEDNRANGVTGDVRHLSVGSKEGLPRKLSSKLRTLFASSEKVLKTLFEAHSNCLRALSLVNVGLEELPNLIGELRQLRYLDISQNKEMETLPDGLTKLFNLQTLRVCPAGLILPGRTPKLPKGFANLINLRHFSTNIGVYMGIPANLGMLTSLRTFPGLDLRDDIGGRISELGTLNNLKGRLEIRGLENVKIDEAKKVNLGKKENLVGLVLEWNVPGDRRMEESEKDKEVLEALQPPPNLVDLEIKNYHHEELPPWMMELSRPGNMLLGRLESLRIYCCNRVKQLPSLRNLVALKRLTIRYCKQLISPPDLEYLASLEELVLYGLTSLRSPFTYDSLRSCTSLLTLDIYDCDEMEYVADLTPFVNLQSLDIMNCKKMTCLPAGISTLSKLSKLRVGPLSPELDAFPFPNDNPPLPPSLRWLVLNAEGMNKVTSLPDQIQHIENLKSLDIKGFSSLEALPEWLGNITSLQRLALENLQQVKCLPSKAAIDRLKRLKTLYIRRCPHLKELYGNKTGREWSRIKHILYCSHSYCLQV